MGQNEERNNQIAFRIFHEEFDGRIFKNTKEVMSALEDTYLKYLEETIGYTYVPPEPLAKAVKEIFRVLNGRGWIKEKGIIEIIIDDNER